MAGDLPALGVQGAYLLTNLTAGHIGPETELELLVIHQTDELYHHRPDFFVTHLRPRVGTRFFVYTPAEFDALADDDPVVRRAFLEGELIDAGQ